MTAKSNYPTRICSVCGIEKPMSAFLQISGLKGSGYGNICATCRGKGATTPAQAQKKETADGGTTSADVRIDADSRQVAEFNQNNAAIEKTETTRKDLELKEKLSGDLQERKATREQFEKQVREEFLKSKQNLFSQSGQKPTDAKSRAERIARAGFISEVERATATQNLEAAAKSETDLTTIDLTKTFSSEQLQRVVHHSETMSRFRDWIGDAPIVRAMDVFSKKKVNSQQLYKKAPETKAEMKQEKDPVLDFEKKNWSPSLKKK